MQNTQNNVMHKIHISLQ